jgi:hypothetical protein
MMRKIIPFPKELLKPLIINPNAVRAAEKIPIAYRILIIFNVINSENEKSKSVLKKCSGDKKGCI